MLLGDDAGVHKSTLCKVMKEMTVRLRPQYVKIPTNEQQISKVKAAVLKLWDFRI